MTKFFRSIFCLFVFLSIPCFAGKDKTHCIPTKGLNESNLAFASGERLTYAVQYKWGLVNADVAEAVMKVDTASLNGRQVFHASISGRILKFYESFFKVKESLDSWFTRDGFMPLKFSRVSREGKYWLNNNSSFVWYDSFGTVTANLETSRKGYRSMQKELTDCTLDIPTMFYLIRNADFSQLEEGKSYPLSFIMDDDVYTLHCVYFGEEIRNVSGVEKVKCVKLGFEVVAGEVFSGDSDLLCWLTADESRIPVQFRIPLKVGEVKARLSDYQGLKNPIKVIAE